MLFGYKEAGGGGGGCGSLGKLQCLVGGCSKVVERETDEEQDLRIKHAKASTDVQVGPFGSTISNASQLSHWSRTNFQAAVVGKGIFYALDSVGREVGNNNDSTSTKVEEYEHRMDLTDDLLHMVFSFLYQTQLRRAALVCKQWRAASTHEDFWRCLDFEYRRISPQQFDGMCRRYPSATEMNILETPSVHVLSMNAVSSLRKLEVLTLGKAIGGTLLSSID